MGRKEDFEKLTEYEKARIVGARALQLAMGAPPLVKMPDGYVSAVRLAFLEWDKHAIPLRVIHAAQ